MAKLFKSSKPKAAPVRQGPSPEEVARQETEKNRLEKIEKGKKDFQSRKRKGRASLIAGSATGIDGPSNTLG